MPLFADLARLLSSEGPVNWQMARQVAQWAATEGQAEVNVDPLERMRLDELARVAELQMAEATGLPTAVTGRALRTTPVTRSEWALRSLEAYRPLLERLAGSLAVPGDPDEGTAPDPSRDLIGGLSQMLGPVLLGMQSGFMVGHMARRSLGQYDLPLPRPASDELLVVPANVDAFASEWSLPPDDLRLWVCLSEVAHHAVLGRPHVVEELNSLLLEYAGGFDVDAGGLEDRLGSVDLSDPQSLQSVMGDPEALLGAMQSEEQRRILPRLAALTAAIEGYVDHMMDTLGRRLIASYGMASEALRRRRVQAPPGERYVGSLLGLELGQDHYDRGIAFVRGVVDRAGPDALARLWASARELPTPAEVDAPGLWLERIDLPD
jgi:putative hydrolase